MKTKLAPLLAVYLIVHACASHAAGLDEQYLAQCQVQVSQRYGPGREIKLVSMRRSMAGASLKVAVGLGNADAGTERVEFTTCRVSRNDLPDAAAKDGPQAPAAMPDR